MEIKVKYKETYINTFYINFEAQYKETKYNVCVDFAEGIQDIEIKPINGVNDYQSLFDDDNIYIQINKDKKQFIKAIEMAVDKQNIKQNIQF